MNALERCADVLAILILAFAAALVVSWLMVSIYFLLGGV